MYQLPARATARIFSYGGGVQSNAVLALQAMGKLLNPYDVFVFSNVGEDSENPETLRYVNEIAKPFAEKHKIGFVEVSKILRNGRKDTLKQHIYRSAKSVPIPARMSNGSPGNRSCTNDFKIKVIDKYVKTNGFQHAVIGVGISLDEFHRMRPHMLQWSNVENPNAKKPRKLGFYKRVEYPLIDYRINRQMCLKILSDAGLPRAPKSSCFFCPFKKRSEWIDLKRNTPELFNEAVKIDTVINDKRGAMGKDRVYLHADLVPLEQAVGNQLTLFTDEEMDICETGYCFV